MSETIPENLSILLKDFGSKMLMSNGSDVRGKLDVPDMEHLLQKEFGDEVIVIHKKVERLPTNGQGFSSKLLKIEIKLQRSISSRSENVCIIAKTPIFAVPIDWTSIFKKEIFLYSHIMPLYKRFETDWGVREDNTIINILPKFYGSRMSLNYDADTADENAAIFLENLNMTGYHLMDKNIGLDFDHASLALQALARFHALGISGRKRFTSDFDTIKNSKWMGNPIDHNIVNVMYTCFVGSIKQDTRFNKHLPKVIKMLEREKAGWQYELVRHDLWTTIVHNDFWTNNIMFHNNVAGEVDNIKIIDHQLYVYADIFVDLSYFLFTSLNDDVKMKRFDEVLDVYYTTFVTHLKKLGVEIQDYTKEKFNQRFEEVAGYNFLRIAVMLNLFTNDIDGADRQNFFTSLITGKGSDLYFKKLEQLFTIYEKKNWLHVN